MDLDGAALSHGAMRIHPADRACPWQLSPGNVLHRLIRECTPDTFAGTDDKESTSFSLHPAASGIRGGGRRQEMPRNQPGRCQKCVLSIVGALPLGASCDGSMPSYSAFTKLIRHIPGREL